jgi:hypothetical protein
MLFDLRGRRRRAVQATYLTLAVLMGGGLVLFGIGGDVSGGLFDAFSERGGGGGDNSLIEKRIERNEKRVAVRPKDRAALAELVRDHYQLGQQDVSPGQELSKDAREELTKASTYWKRYAKASGERRIDPSLANLAAQLFSPQVLNRPKDAVVAARLLAEHDNSAQAYLQLVQYAALAGDTRTADLAAQKAVDLAPKDQRSEVKRLAEEAKSPPQQQPGAQGG